MSEKVFLAVDLGAESGRVMAGCFDGDLLRIDEVHRFANVPVRVRGSLHWDILYLFSEIKRGISLAAKRYGANIVSIGVDTWGVDYGLLDAQGGLLGHPFHYRDSRTNGMMEEAYRRLSKRGIYAETGIQFMFFNTIFQVLSEVVRGAPALASAARLLFIPDLLQYWLSGVSANERTIASTSQIYNPRGKTWSTEVIEALGLPPRIFGDIVDPGTVLGPVLPEVADETGAGPILVVTPGCHDTASGVAAVPARGNRHAYLSSGTWSLMGVEASEPVIDDRSYEFGFTNEIGVFDTVRLLKNISGLWLVQECRRTWAARGEDASYDELTRLASAAEPFAAVLNPDFPDFALPGDMPARFRDFCLATGQRPPVGVGSTVRTALESLALKYRFVLEQLEMLLGRRIDVLHIVGGGSRNDLLNQFTANALNRQVITGPVEATSAGNILMQMAGTGVIASHDEGREVIRRSFETRTYEPSDAGAWKDVYTAFLKLQSAEQPSSKEKEQHG
jgi:rhamnulokinase